MSRDAIREEDFYEITVTIHGSLFKTRRHKTEGYYTCPVCGIGDMEPIFFSEEDIIHHIKHHILQGSKYSKKRG